MAGLKLKPESGASRALASQLVCWTKSETGEYPGADPRIAHMTCCEGDIYHVPAAVCADHGPPPFTSDGEEIPCTGEETQWKFYDIRVSDVQLLDTDTCEPADDLAQVVDVAVSDVTDVTATVSWTAVAGATGYDVEYTIAGGASVTVQVTDPTAPLAGLTPSSAYSVRVRATADAMAGPWSASVEFTTTVGG